MAHLYDGQGDREAASKCYQQAVETYRETGDLWAITHPLCDLAWKIWDQGDTHQARLLMEEQLAAFRQLQPRTGGLSMALSYMISITTWMGDFTAAEKYLNEKREIDLSFNNDLSEAITLLDDANLKFFQGDYSTARMELESALAKAQKKSDYLFISMILRSLGNVRLREGRLSEGTAILEESIKLAKSTSVVDPYYLPDILLDYTGAVLMNGDLKHAQSLFRQSLEGVRDSMPRIPSRLEGLAKAAGLLGNLMRAVKLLGAAQSMRKKMSLPLPPVYLSGYEYVLSDLRNTLDEGAFQQAWNSGLAMSVDKSVEFALEECIV